MVFIPLFQINIRIQYIAHVHRYTRYTIFCNLLGNVMYSNVSGQYSHTIAILNRCVSHT